MEELTGLDARFLYSETPTGHMHTLKIVVFDLSGRTADLTATEFVERMRARLDRMPILRRRAWSRCPTASVTRCGSRTRTST